MKFLFGIGVEKCGTTSLNAALRPSPHFNTATKKETFFFSRDFDKGPDYFESLFPRPFAAVDGYTVDFTPSYFRHPDALARLRDFNADKKFIISLRCPARRAWSFYLHDLRNHVALGQRSNKFRAPSTARFSDHFAAKKDYYFTRYAALLENAFDTFGRDNCHVVIFEDLINDWQTEAGKLDRFLGFDQPVVARLALPHNNPASEIPFIFDQKVRKNGRYRVAQKRRGQIHEFPNLGKRQLSNALALQDSFELSVPAALAAEVRDWFKDDVKAVEKLLGRPVADWLQPTELQANFETVTDTDRDQFKQLRQSAQSKKQRRSVKGTAKKSRPEDASIMRSAQLLLHRLTDRLRNRPLSYMDPVNRRSRHKRVKNASDLSVDGQWPGDATELPWFDQDTAMDYIAGSRAGVADKDLMRGWVRDGYVIRDVVSAADCDAMRSEMTANIWGGGKTIPNLKIIGVRGPEESHGRTVMQPDLARYAAEERAWMMQDNNWRVHGMMNHSAIGDKIARLPEIVRIASLLYGEPAEAGFALSFGNGSEQTLHQDISVFNIYPRNFLIGVWIALEDIHPDSGPLMFYGGSHRLGLWSGHAVNYPQTNIRSGTVEERDAYFHWLQKESDAGFEKQHLLIKKGQALFWHAGLAHGGSKRKDTTRTRNSYILHMVPRNRDVDKRLVVKGPFI